MVLTNLTTNIFHVNLFYNFFFHIRIGLLCTLSASKFDISIQKTLIFGFLLSSMEDGNQLQVVMFPWLAMGHLIPFLQLSKLLAQKGCKIYFVSTPRNLDRLPKIPPKLSSKITLVSFPLSYVPNLPPHAESSADIPYNKQQLLKKAFDLLQTPLATFLESSKPDWVIYDYASHWLPSVAAKLGISCAFFSLFTAACLSFIGPPSELMNCGDSRHNAEDFTVKPKWVPFESNVVYHLHEVTKYVEKPMEDESEPNDVVRFGFAAGESDVVVIRSSPEFEPEWFNLLGDLHEKPIIPVGFLPPLLQDEDEGRKWGDIKKWLDKQGPNSVVYVALGTEASLTREELSELALGLEKSMLPFFWVLKNPPGSTENVLEMLPDGFEEQVKDRGVVYLGWAPQVKILSHNSVGGFLTHCGWNSVLEGLAFGRVLILFPVLNDQGLNARLLHGKKLGLEIPRNKQDGSFMWNSVADSVRMAMVDDSGESWRDLAKEMRGLIGDRDRNDRFVDRFVRYLEENRSSLLMA